MGSAPQPAAGHGLTEHRGLIHGWLEIVDVVQAAEAARDRLLEGVRELIERVTPTRPTTSKEQ